MKQNEDKKQLELCMSNEIYTSDEIWDAYEAINGHPTKRLPNEGHAYK